MTPAVTVLVPVYNGEGLVDAAIESVLAQTYRDFELLLIDDCSTDGSCSVIGSYEDTRIRLVRNETNLGQIGTLNRGLAEARGRYVARLDQDDRALPERLARQVEILETEPEVALVGTWMTVVDDEGRQMAWLQGRLDDYVDFLFDALTNQLKLGHPSVMFRRDAVLELGGYDASVRLAEDKDLWRRLLLAGHEARIVTEPLVLYLLHPGQQSQKSWREQQDNDAVAYARFVRELSSRVEPEAVRQLLSWDDRLWPALTRERARELAAMTELLLEDTVARLALTPDQHAKLDRLVRRRVELAARRSWRTSIRAHRVAAPAFEPFALARRAGGERLGSVLAFRFVRWTAPALRAGYLAERAAFAAIRPPSRLARLKRLGKRSRRLVALYQRLGGGA